MKTVLSFDIAANLLFYYEFWGMEFYGKFNTTVRAFSTWRQQILWK